MKNVKLIASDMDHTLLMENGKLPDGFFDYIDRLDEKGIRFVVASGRPMYTLRDMFGDKMDRWWSSVITVRLFPIAARSYTRA